MKKIYFNPLAQAQASQQTADMVRNGYDAPAALVSIAKNNVVTSGASGISDISTGEKAKAGQEFEIGSQTKMFTSVVILQLAEKGLLDLNGLAKQYLPQGLLDGIANADNVTIHDLLAMRSGIANYTDIQGSSGISAFVEEALNNPDKIVGDTEALNLVRGVPANFAAGSQSEYSNTNYTILGEIIENITGNSLESEYSKRIFAPAGMTNTTMDRFSDTSNRIHGYQPDPSSGKLLDETYLNWDPAAAGGAISTTEDMIKFLQALFEDRILLNDSSIAKMILPTFSEDDNQTIDGVNVTARSLGLGMITYNVNGDIFYGFSGATVTSLSSSYISATTGDVISVAGNLAGIFNRNNALTPDVSGIIALAKTINDTSWSMDKFNPTTDILVVKDLSAASFDISATKNTTTIKYDSVSLEIDKNIANLKTNNFSFTDGSKLIIGSDQKGDQISIAANYKNANNFDNQILGLGGNDTLSGGRGNDKISGGNGADIIRGDSGNDTIFGEQGNDYINGGSGKDSILGGDGNDLISADAGNDYINAGSGNDVVYGGRDDDSIYGEGGNDLISGDAGNDYINAGSGNDTINGGIGNDTIVAGAGNDLLYGGAGNDTFYSTFGGKDTISGGAGNDTFIFRSASESVTTGGNWTKITDFAVNADKINLVGLNDLFTTITTAATTVAGQLKAAYDSATNSTFLTSDQNAFAIQLANGNFVNTLDNGDFIF
jgi:D-alanyl-D-alanine carboxypeptidase